jgi:hypothetical protein
MDKDHKKFMADWNNLLHSSVDVAFHSPQRICIVTDMSTPALPLQSVVVFRLWHEGDLYNGWSAASLGTSDDAKLQAVMDGIHQAYNVGLEDVCQAHVFSNVDTQNSGWGNSRWLALHKNMALVWRRGGYQCEGRGPCPDKQRQTFKALGG